MNIMEVQDDDRSSSADSFSLVEDQHQNKADDCDGGDDQNKEKPEPPSKSTLKQPSVVEVAKVSYLGFFVKVYADVNSLGCGLRRFYHDPIVLLDRDSIVSEFNELLKQDLVRFKIKMWNAEIRAKVINRLRSLPSLMDVEIQEDDVHVMPYEEVQLVAKHGGILKSIRLADEATSYLQLNESLDFDFDCDLASVADSLADNLKKNPQLIVKRWKLVLECRGLALGSGAESAEMISSKMTSRKRPTWIFNVSTALENDTTQKPVMDNLLPLLEGYDNKIQDLQQQILAKSNGNSATCVPVFSVETCKNPAAAQSQSFGFSTFLIDTNINHVNFDLPSGTFTVKTAGTYQLNFNALVLLSPGNSGTTHRVDLKINGQKKAASLNHSNVETGGYQPVVISALVALKTGDVVGIYAFNGKLYQDNDHKPRFSAVLFFEQPI